MTSDKSRYVENGIIAEVLYTARNPFTRKIVVDKGLTDSIQPGMPVIDGTGVVGQVTNVGTFTSEVTLVTEKDQSVPVMVVRNGLRAIAVGSGKDGSIDIPFMPVSADVQNGDMFVTSGIDGTYPPGLVVAEVTTVQKDAARVFAKISAKPAAGVDYHRYVMLLPLSQASAPPPDAKADDAPQQERQGPRSRPEAAVMRPADLTPACARRDEDARERGPRLLLARRRLPRCRCFRGRANGCWCVPTSCCSC